MGAAVVGRRVRDRLKYLPPVYWVLRWARMAVGAILPPRQLAGVPGRIHANDSMIPRRVPEHVPGYVGSGKQIATLIGEHLGPEPPDGRSRVGLDLGCGYGRVLRHLVGDLPSLRWTAADVDRRALRFCRREFGVAGVISSRRLTEVRFPDAPFDVVWMGSLLTHLPPPAADDLWRMLGSNLRPGGLLALSTHGPDLLGRVDEWVPDGGRQLARLAGDLEVSGVAYLPYPHYRRVGYGVAFHTPDAITSQARRVFGPGTQLLSMGRRSWLETQDLYVFRVGGPTRRGA